MVFGTGTISPFNPGVVTLVGRSPSAPLLPMASVASSAVDDETIVAHISTGSPDLIFTLLNDYRVKLSHAQLYQLFTALADNYEKSGAFALAELNRTCASCFATKSLSLICFCENLALLLRSFG